MKKSYKPNMIPTTGIKINASTEGESIEEKVERIINNKEPIEDGAPAIYTERKEGVIAAYNIRTDKWDVALEATDYITKSRIAERENKAKMEVVKTENDSSAESTEATNK